MDTCVKEIAKEKVFNFDITIDGGLSISAASIQEVETAQTNLLKLIYNY